MSPCLSESAPLETYLDVNAHLRQGLEQDLSFLTEKVRPGALLAYKGELLEVRDGFIGTHAAYADAHRVSDVDALDQIESCPHAVVLQTRGLLLARLVAPAPTCPDTL